MRTYAALFLPGGVTGAGSLAGAAFFGAGALRQFLPDRISPDIGQDAGPDILRVDWAELLREDVMQVAVDRFVSVRQANHAHDGVAVEGIAVVAVLHAIEVMWHLPAASLLVRAHDHLLADLDQVELDQDLVDG